MSTNKVLKKSLKKTYGCLAISLLSMALILPESRDKTADSIVAITVNFQLIVVVTIDMDTIVVSNENKFLKKSPAWDLLTWHLRIKSLL